MAKIKLTLRWVLLSLIFLFFPGCSTMLGTYMSAGHPKGTYYFNGQEVTVHFVNLTPDWIAKNQKVPVYTVGPYDILNVIVWDHPELTTLTTQLSSAEESGFLVDANGTITFPFAGTFKVAGFTVSQIQAIIARHISKYIRDPQVTVRVTSFRSREIHVMGEVGSLKIIPLMDRPFSLLDALNTAGGTNATSSNTANILVIRGTLAYLTIYRLNAKSPQMMMAAQRFYMENNDIIYVPSIPITDWNRFISQLLPTLGLPATVRATSAEF